MGLIATYGCQSVDDTQKADGDSGASYTNEVHYKDERHLANIRQLTDGGDNAEAYFSFDGTKLVFQSNYTEWGLQCDQIFVIPSTEDSIIRKKPQQISDGHGRTTCSYFMPGDTSVIFASTSNGANSCPPEPDKSQGYVWPIYQDFDIYVANLQGKIIDTIIKGPGYDAEATISPKGDKIVFTSDRSGDLELYVCDIDGSNIVQITQELGYDGGAFFSPDGTQLVFRSSRPKTEEEVKHYKNLLAQHLVEPSDMEIYVCNVDGSQMKQITKLGNANWAPFFHPNGKKIIFSSNHASEKGIPFNLYMIDIETGALEKITSDPTFDAFPMFSPDGKKLIFSSNRNNKGTRNTNLFIADWVE